MIKKSISYFQPKDFFLTKIVTHLEAMKQERSSSPASIKCFSQEEETVEKYWQKASPELPFPITTTTREMLLRYPHIYNLQTNSDFLKQEKKGEKYTIF